MTTLLPLMFRVQQSFPPTPRAPIGPTLERLLPSALQSVRPRQRVAIATGSRGITQIGSIVTEVARLVRATGAEPFIIPAMGSHGGATPEGQTELLGEYGITPQSTGAPIRASMDVEKLGASPDGIDVFFSSEALKADHVIVINRIKPHTDFSGSIGSGILKMIVVGLGKRTGAAHFHIAASRHGYERVLRSIARVLLKRAPILCGVAIIENEAHDTAKIEVIPRDQIEAREEELFVQARDLMPRIPFDSIDLLIIDRIGKNISGAGMDPNIIGRSVHGYSSFLGDQDGKSPRQAPFIRRIVVRDLTPETHGNAIGIGFADFTTARLVRKIDRNVSAINALTSLTPQSVKVPIYFESDRESIIAALNSLALPDPKQARIVRIADTLSLEHFQVSEVFTDEIQKNSRLQITRPAEEMKFDADGNLADPIHS